MKEKSHELEILSGAEKRKEDRQKDDRPKASLPKVEKG